TAKHAQTARPASGTKAAGGGPGAVYPSKECPVDETRYGLKVAVPVPFDAAVMRATDALKTQGFGVLTTIDVQQTLKAKLDRDFRKYVILGACNPPLAD